MMKVAIAAVLLLAAAMLVQGQAQSPSAYKITDLPGLPAGNLTFNQYSGYVNVEGYGQMFFWFVESQNSPSEDPLVVWLNGGPGCSSLGGFLGENGPWFPNLENQLVENPYSWNLIANMLFIESPAGVGFSIQDSPSFDEWTDDLAAEGNYEFLQNWLTSFSDFQENDFYVTGESYAGHYIPTLVDKIYEGNKDSSNLEVNIKGFMVGNPATDESYDGGELYDDYFTSHGIHCLDKKSGGFFGGIYNPYDILNDVCYSTALANKIRFPNPYVDALKEALKEEALKEESHATARNVPGMPPCIADTTASYLNEPSVQSAIHAEPTNWSDCGGIRYQRGKESIVPIYEKLISQSDYRILVYSGDADTVVPFIGTERWCLDMANNLDLSIDDKWGPWYSKWSGNGPQVAGYYINYGQFQYATVKGAGHEVPWFQPGSSYDLFYRYLNDQSLHG